jgi:hypothetical protein
MKIVASILLTILVFTYCSSNEQANESIPKAGFTNTKTGKKEKANTANKGGFKLEFFTSIPDDIDGCGEFFTYDTSTVDDEHYILLSDMDVHAIINIRGKDVHLKKNTRQSKEINELVSVEVYYGGGYKVTLRKKKEKVINENIEYSGTLQISGKKIKATYKIHGEGGC